MQTQAHATLKAKFTIPAEVSTRLDARASAEDKTRSQVVSELLGASLDFADRLAPSVAPAVTPASSSEAPEALPPNAPPKQAPSSTPHLHRPRKQAQGWVYFLQPQGRPTAEVKIGFSERSIVARLKNLQTASPEPLTFLAAIPGTRETERELHRRFAEVRVCGEYFVAAPVLAYLGSLGREAASHA
jgi:hypothetical protein